MAIGRDRVVVVTEGENGEAVGTGRTQHVVNGIVKAVHIDYDDAASTTTVAITEGNESPPLPVLAVGENNTDGWYFPVRAASNAADGVEVVDGDDNPLAMQPVVVSDHLLVSVGGADGGDTITVTIVWESQ